MDQPLFCDQVLPHILGLQPYVPGKPISELQREYQLTRISKLASNENPLGSSDKVYRAVQEALADMARYPDGNAYELKSRLSEFLGLSQDRLLLGNGSNELLELVARAVATVNDEIIFSQYAFAVYPISCQAVGATAVEVPAKHWGHDLPAMLAAITPKTKLIYIANPNNPTGTMFSRAEWTAFIRQVPSSVIVVLDEAYFEYVNSDDYANGIDYIDDYPNLLVSRTFSKAYGLAALRIGYMVGHASLIGYLNRLRAPFNVNHYAQVGALAALDDQAFVEKSIEVNRQGMEQLEDFCRQMDLSYIPSFGNFVCIKFGSQAPSVNQKLLEKGVIVRPVSNYGMSEYLRVSIGLPQENQHFMDALKKILTS